MSDATIRTLQVVAQVEPRLAFRTIHGYRRAYRIAGEGPPILLIHGIGDNSETWTDIIPHLATDHMVIAPDLLGHGRSDKPRADYSAAAYANGLRDLLAVLDIDRVTIVGHSLGGGLAMQFAYQFPHLVERLVLVCAGGVSGEVHPVFRLASAPLVSSALRVLAIPGARAVIDVLGRMVDEFAAAGGLGFPSVAHDARDGVRVIGGLADGAGNRAFLRTLRSAVDWRGQVITMLDRVYLNEHIPVQIIWGAWDALVPVRHAHLAHAGIPGSHLEIFEDSGHFPFRDDPLRFVRVVRQFLESTEPGVFDDEAWRAALVAGIGKLDVPGGPRDRLAVLDALEAGVRSAT